MIPRPSAPRPALPTLALLFGSAFVTTAFAQGRTLHVPSQYPTIRSAIAAAVHTDTVLVAPGTYVENLDFLGKAITVRSAAGPALTTVDGNGAGTVVSFVNGEGRDSVLEGFRITNGTGTLIGPIPPHSQLVVGGGIFCDGASPTIRGNEVTGNAIRAPSTGVGGGGIACARSASPRIEHNEIHGNTIVGRFGGGAGIACHTDCDAVIVDNDIHDNSGTGPEAFGGGGILCFLRCDAVVSRNRIHRNTIMAAGGIQCVARSAMTVTDNVIYQNTTTIGGGIQFYLNDVPMEIVGNTIFGNTAADYGGGLYCNTVSTATIRNTIIWGNTAANGAQVSVNDTATLDLEYCDVEGGRAAGHVDPSATLNWGPGMLAVEPLFVNAGSGDFSLQPTSPCVDVGDPSSGFCLDLDFGDGPRLLDGTLSGAARIDIGADEFGNVHLEINGSATPGGTVSLVTTGRAGLQVYLIVGADRGAICVTPFGPVFLDPARIWVATEWGRIPGSVPLAIPLGFPAPADILFQQIALDPATMAGNTSNLAVLEIR